MTLSKLSECGNSLCYRCSHYEWELLLQDDPMWRHICKVNEIPGDHVVSCNKYLKVGHGN